MAKHPVLLLAYGSLVVLAVLAAFVGTGTLTILSLAAVALVGIAGWTYQQDGKRQLELARANLAQIEAGAKPRKELHRQKLAARALSSGQRKPKAGQR